MKRVGIITFHCADNFGAVLQAYALQRVIEDLGAEVEIIDFRPRHIVEPYLQWINVTASLRQRGLLQTAKAILGRFYMFQKIRTRRANFADFRAKYLRLSAKVYLDSTQLIREPPRYDYYVTGSDQVWNPHFYRDVGGSYFLDFVGEGSRKISYAASIADDIDERFYPDFANYLTSFDWISVREKSAEKLLRKLIDRPIHVTLDPTLLLSRDVWTRVSTPVSIRGKYIVAYDLVRSSTLSRVTNLIARRRQCGVISYSPIKRYANQYGWFYCYNPMEFVGLISGADFVVTSSFHGMAFAILFGKPFYAVLHPTRGSRMVDLLDDLGLQDRLIVDRVSPSVLENSSIDYEAVYARLSALRARSLDFLRAALDVH